MEPRPQGYTIERKDNDLGYSKANCEWVTQSDQVRNQRRRKTALSDEKILGIFYSCLPVMLVASKYGIDKRTVYDIKNLKGGEYTTRICRRYKLVEGVITLKE